MTVLTHFSNQESFIELRKQIVINIITAINELKRFKQD